MVELPDEWRERAELIALRRRASIGLDDRTRLDPLDLADDLGVRVMTVSSLPGLPDGYRSELLRTDSKALSAVTVFRDRRILIVVNDAHTAERQVNSLAHELAHIELDHAPGPALDALGNRLYPERFEAEADWLAGCFLIPSSGLPGTLREVRTLQAIAAHYGVSIELARWRCNANRLTHLAA